jgi:ABC-2 type transport system permease protein
MFPAVLSGLGLLVDRQFGFLKETLVAPVPRFAIMLGRTFGVATVALIQGALVIVICFLFGFRPASLALAPTAVAFLLLIAFVFSGLGLIIGSTMQGPNSFTPVMNFVAVPLFFFSGAFYPLDHLPPALAVLTYVNPLSYGVDGLRSALIGSSHFGASLDASVLALLALALISIGAWRFSKIEA